MAIPNKDRISRTLDLLRDGLVPFVERELKAKLGSSWLKSVDTLRPIREAQVLTCLRLGGWTVGLLINFNVPVSARRHQARRPQLPGHLGVLCASAVKSS